MATGNWTLSPDDNRPGVGYNYTNITSDHVKDEKSAYIARVSVSKVVANRGDFKNINPDVYTAFVDFDIEKQRFPRV